MRRWPLFLVLAGCTAEGDRLAPRLAADLALVCDATSDCDAAWIGDDGAVTRFGRGGLLAAMRLDADRLVLLTVDHELVLRDAVGAEPDARERVIARDVADPRVGDGRRVVFTQLPPDADIAPDTVGHLVVLDLDRGTRRTIDDHPTNSSPFLLPGSDDAIFVSSRTGVASLYLARPGAPLRQLTNVGMHAVGPGFVPVPGRALAFEGRTAVYTATYGGVATSWRVEVPE